MTDTQTQIPLTGDQSVEDQWHSILTKEGVEPADAEGIVRSLQTHPLLAFGNPDPETVEEVIEEATDGIDLAEAGVERVENTRSRMKETLSEGLWGDRPGPVSLSKNRAQPESDADAAVDRLEPQDAPQDGASSKESASDQRDESYGQEETAPANADHTESAKAAETQPGAEDEAAEFTPDTEPMTGDETGHLTEAALAGGQPAAQAQTNQTQANMDANKSRTESATETASDSPDLSNIDVETLIANLAVSELREEVDQVDWDDEKEALAGMGAEAAIELYQHELQELLFPQLSDTEQQLGYKWLVQARLREELTEKIKNASQEP